MKTFLNFTRTGSLSGARIVGYAGGEEASFSFESLALAVYGYIKNVQNSLPVAYRFTPESTIHIANTNKTTAIYLSSSVLNVDISLPGENWLTLTKTGSYYSIDTYTDILSTNKDILRPGDWVYIKNTALSSFSTLYFQSTGTNSVIMSVEEGAPTTPTGLSVTAASALQGDKAMADMVETSVDFARASFDAISNLISLIIIPNGSNNYPSPSDECQAMTEQLLAMKAELEAATKKLDEAMPLIDKIALLIEVDKLAIKGLMSFPSGVNPCGPMASPIQGYDEDSSEVKNLRKAIKALEKEYDDLKSQEDSDVDEHQPARLPPPVTPVG